MAGTSAYVTSMLAGLVSSDCSFTQRKDSYSLFPVDGTLSLPVSYFHRIGVTIYAKIERKTLILDLNSDPYWK